MSFRVIQVSFLNKKKNNINAIVKHVGINTSGICLSDRKEKKSSGNRYSKEKNTADNSKSGKFILHQFQGRGFIIIWRYNILIYK